MAGIHCGFSLAWGMGVWSCQIGVVVQAIGFVLHFRLLPDEKYFGICEDLCAALQRAALEDLFGIRDALIEASRVTDGVYRAMRPMLAVGGGDLWLMSTPWRRHEFFYDEWTHGGDVWMRVSVKATECSRIPASFLPASFLEEERRSMGTAFQREYMCEFVDSSAKGETVNGVA